MFGMCQEVLPHVADWLVGLLSSRTAVAVWRLGRKVVLLGAETAHSRWDWFSDLIVPPPPTTPPPRSDLETVAHVFGNLSARLGPPQQVFPPPEPPASRSGVASRFITAATGMLPAAGVGALAWTLGCCGIRAAPGAPPPGPAGGVGVLWM